MKYLPQTTLTPKQAADNIVSNYKRNISFMLIEKQPSGGAKVKVLAVTTEDEVDDITWWIGALLSKRVLEGYSIYLKGGNYNHRRHLFETIESKLRELGYEHEIKYKEL